MLSCAASASYGEENHTILALGDSLTTGYGLPDGQGLVPQLNLWLAEHQAAAGGAQITVLNGGVSGDTSAGGLSRLDWSLSPEVDAMIVTLGGNDMLRGLPPTETRKNIDTILTEAKARNLPVLLIGMKAPGNFGAEYRDRFDALYPELAAAHNVLLVESYFGLLKPEATDLTQLDGLMLPDGIHPNAEGIQIIAKALGPHVVKLAAQIKD